MPWKVILACAVLMAPMSYCTVEEYRIKTDYKIECAKVGGVYRSSWGGTCGFDE